MTFQGFLGCFQFLFQTCATFSLGEDGVVVGERIPSMPWPRGLDLHGEIQPHRQATSRRSHCWGAPLTGWRPRSCQWDWGGVGVAAASDHWVRCHCGTSARVQPVLRNCVVRTIFTRAAPGWERLELSSSRPRNLGWGSPIDGDWAFVGAFFFPHKTQEIVTGRGQWLLILQNFPF